MSNAYTPRKRPILKEHKHKVRDKTASPYDASGRANRTYTHNRHITTTNQGE